MAETFFISDAHLGASSVKKERLKEEKLLSFFEYVAENGERLFIVGDLFDFWFEYRTVVPKGYTRVLCALSRLNELGIELHYIAGNHDFWMKDYLASQYGFEMHFDEVDITIQNRRFYLFHGDGLARYDTGYRILKRIFRNRFNIFLYSLLHPDLGVPLARWISSLSRKHTRQEKVPSDKDYINKSLQKFEEGFDYAIFGHLHSPRYQEFGQKVYINLGDWIDNFNYAVFNGSDIRLLQWRT
ncbi:MAG: UDP-2,3-diacylglucosamine diphosphatase [Calditrichaeota bacterium]|nr:MAG: UDP-2,3-diacylglucosamine diphosphatase [Calditrichota bacterium]